jgi:chemotaxis protein methyltransferase CheR
VERLDHINKINNIYKTQLGDSEFKRLSTFIYSELGIKMPEVKKTMLQSRLQKRLNDLQKYSFKEYIDFVFSKDGQGEMVNMLDIVTTNKTDFFRESGHFEFLNDKILPEFIMRSNKPVLKVWSAGCSSGEEPYTLAMILSEFRDHKKEFDFQITGTDISTRMLVKAATAIYNEDRVANISENLKKRYLLKSKDDQKKTVRIVPELRSKVNFFKVNFMSDVYKMNGQFDVIFCRNVLIYFDRKTQEEVINKLCSYLKPGGYFFLGHSESITNFNVPLKQVQSTIFMKLKPNEL